MLRRIFITMICTLMSIMSFSQEKRALLIGVGHYGDDTGWSEIHGDNDVAIVTSTLLKNGFSRGNITSLLNQQATYEGIRESFNKLILDSQRSDVIYIQFSGHGQQITDLDGDEEDGLDEAWIPYDAFKTYSKGVYEGECHFTDDILYGYLKQLRAKVGKQGKIIVVSDACHSGGGSRGVKDDSVVRGAKEIFVIPGEHKTYIPSTTEDAWLFVAACKSYQNNFEYRRPDGTYCGTLSYIISADSHDFNTSSYEMIINGWKSSMKKISKYPQTIDNTGRPSVISEFLF